MLTDYYVSGRFRLLNRSEAGDASRLTRRSSLLTSGFGSEASRLKYYPRFPGDYANDTRHLSFVEHGAYALMMDWCYANERPLPKDKQEIYRKLCASTPEEERAIDDILREFFRLRKRGYFQKKIVKEISRFKAKSDVRRVSGRKGGLKHQAIAKQLLSKPQASQNHKPEPEPKPESTSLPSAKFNGNGAGALLTEREEFARSSFEKFWDKYPKKLDQDATFQRWLALSPIEQDVATESVDLWVKSKEWDDPQFVMSPENFLRKRRWESKPVQGGKRNVTKEAAARLRAEIENN
jgi:uncharacterized protein YdaU (DUF1376 family)